METRDKYLRMDNAERARCTVTILSGKIEVIGEWEKRDGEIVVLGEVVTKCLYYRDCSYRNFFLSTKVFLGRFGFCYI